MSSAQANTATASSPSAEGTTSGRHRGSLLICALVLAYASLYPFQPLRLPANDAIALFFNPGYVSAFDVSLNTLAYMPLGALACLVFRTSGRAGVGGIARAVAAGATFSFTMEMLQLFVPFRVASVVDVMSNTAGTLAGALLFAEPLQALVTQPLARARERFIIPGPWGDAGLVLLTLWMIAQLNPALPFFEAASIGSSEAQPWEAAWSMIALEAIAVTLSVAGFGLFVSVLLNGPGGALRSTVLLLTAALWLKFTMAAMMLKPHFTADWVNEVRVIGLAAGLLLFIPLRVFTLRTRTYLAILLVLAGGLFAKVIGDYSPMDDLVRLFNWPHGQLTTFNSLTRYLHEVWPLLALGFLIASFVVRLRRREDVR